MQSPSPVAAGRARGMVTGNARLLAPAVAAVAAVGESRGRRKGDGARGGEASIRLRCLAKKRAWWRCRLSSAAGAAGNGGFCEV